jgi:DNA-binding MarR family transcriptional regulator
MADPKSNVDIFGSYLSRVATPSQADTGGGSAAPEMSVLRKLSAGDEAVSIKTLIGQLDMPPSQLVQTLKMLNDAKLVEMERVGSDERVSLTGLGRSLAE